MIKGANKFPWKLYGLTVVYFEGFRRLFVKYALYSQVYAISSAKRNRVFKLNKKKKQEMCKEGRRGKFYKEDIIGANLKSLKQYQASKG